jgi:hypothetical protein
MIPNTPDAPATPRPDEAGRTAPLPKLDLSKPIEVASNGTGATNDPPASDKPPGLCDPADPASCL